MGAARGTLGVMGNSLFHCFQRVSRRLFSLFCVVSDECCFLLCRLDDVSAAVLLASLCVLRGGTWQTLVFPLRAVACTACPLRLKRKVANHSEADYVSSYVASLFISGNTALLFCSYNLTAFFAGLKKKPLEVKVAFVCFAFYQEQVALQLCSSLALLTCFSSL
jgi:hypothetical protein